MNPPAWTHGLFVVARHELIGSLGSIRLLTMAVVTMLVIIGGAYGISGLTGGNPFRVPPLVAWAHPTYEADGDHIATVWVSDPFGSPLARRPVEFLTLNETTGNQVLIGTTSTNLSGFANLGVGREPDVIVRARSGSAQVGTRIDFVPPPLANFTVALLRADLDNNGFRDELSIHVLDLNGVPPTARVLVNDTLGGTVDQFGYQVVRLPIGQSKITIEVGLETFSFLEVVAPDPDLPFSSGPDLVLLTTSGLASLVLSVFAIVMGFDAISKERAQGLLDLLLSRPVRRTALLLGKFLAAFAAVALPTSLVSVAGIVVISLASGQSPDGGFSLAFLGHGLLLIAQYVLLQLAVSTVAKTSGRSILYGVFLWFTLSIFYNVAAFVLAAVAFPNDPEAQFRLLQASGLGSPNALYILLLSTEAPAQIRSGFEPAALDAPTLWSATISWFVLPLFVALWAFRRRATD